MEDGAKDGDGGQAVTVKPGAWISNANSTRRTRRTAVYLAQLAELGLDRA
ncbi:hypothetical protein ACIRPX_35110 [Streptomyces sp. NPDC101225]